MIMLNDEMREQLGKIFKDMKKDVTIVLFTKKEPCPTCEETREYM